MLYILDMANIYDNDMPSLEETKAAAKVDLPYPLINYALNKNQTTGQFLKMLVDMSKWDTKETEEFFNKYPGLRDKQRPS